MTAQLGQPLPLVPPPAGTWVRAQYTRHGATWFDGRWHRSTGDLAYRPAWLRVLIHAACGVRLEPPTSYGHGLEQTLAVVDEQPTADACRRCARKRERTSGD